VLAGEDLTLTVGLGEEGWAQWLEMKALMASMALSAVSSVERRAMISKACVLGGRGLLP
jgi:hypothetical protein